MAEGVDQSSETPPAPPSAPPPSAPSLSANSPSAPPPSAPAGAHRRRALRIGLGIAIVLLAVLAGVWLARKPIATRAIDAELARRGITAHYGVSDLGLGRQRLTDVVIGDPAAPDLVADWLEAETRIGLDGAHVVGVRAGHVRLRGRIVDGRLSLGQLDRLTGPSTGAPFALPALHVDVADARVRLATPLGVVGLRIAGRGRLDDGFAGSVAIVADHLGRAACGATRVSAVLRVTIADAAPHLVGPLRVGKAGCDGASVAKAGAEVDARLTPALDGWRGAVRLATGAVRVAGQRAAGLRGTIAFDGGAAGTEGSVDLAATAAAGLYGRADAIGITGRYRIGDDRRFAGTMDVAGGRVSAAILATLDVGDAGRGTPAAPLIAAAGR